MTQPIAMSETGQMISAPRKHALLDAANLCLDARRTAIPIPDLPAQLQPVDLDEVAEIHAAMAIACQTIGGWKIGAPDPAATPFFAPMPLAWIAADGAKLVGPRFRYRGLEAEIAFQLGEDLPPRDTPYTREEVVAAIASCHPAIEELESAFLDPKAAARLSSLADLQMHGGFVYGPAVQNWQAIDFTRETVALIIDGSVRVERTGSNTSGDLMRLLPYLANEGAARTGGLRAGQWITTGSWTGNTPAGPSSKVEVKFGTAGSVHLAFA